MRLVWHLLSKMHTLFGRQSDRVTHNLVDAVATRFHAVPGIRVGDRHISCRAWLVVFGDLNAHQRQAVDADQITFCGRCGLNPANLSLEDGNHRSGGVSGHSAGRV